MTDSTSDNFSKKLNWLRLVVNTLVCLAILSAAAYSLFVINNTQPAAQKLNSVRKSAALVETQTVVRGDYAPKIQVLGTVQAAQRIQLGPQVRGQVADLSANFLPGGMVKKDDLLLRIDPADFENALLISRSELAQANASMEIEQARQRLAEKELKLLDGAIDESNRGLVLREPQVASMKAQVSAAEASVQRAQLNLDRTSIFAPFDAQVLTREVNIGSQVGPGDELGQLVGIEEYWINAAVPVRHLRWIEFARHSNRSNNADSTFQSATELSVSAMGDHIEAGITSSSNGLELGSTVWLRDPDAWGPDVQRKAHVMQMIGTLNQETRLARILISVPDPLGLQSDEPPLIIDSLIETEIEGKTIRDVVKLQRELVRDQDTVWLLENGKLAIKKVEVVFRDADFAYISNGIEAGEELVCSTLATVAEGIRLRKISTQNDETSAPADETP